MDFKKLKYLKRWQFLVMVPPVILFFFVTFCIAIPLAVIGWMIDAIGRAFDCILELLDHESIDRNMRKLIKWGFGK